MDQARDAAHTRRALLKNSGLLAGALVVPQMLSAKVKHIVRQPAPPIEPDRAPLPVYRAVVAKPITSPRVVRPKLLRHALASLDAHARNIPHRDRIAIVDFAAPSSQPRIHLLNLTNGHSVSLLVAHGSGSDPTHTGWLKRFSNQDGSNASCEGAFLTSDYYVGKHGRSQRLIGLDATNNNALSRAIVVHGAWYSNPEMLKTHGMLGRSQGCFAVGEQDLAKLFDRLGPGRMIYAAKV